MSGQRILLLISGALFWGECAGDCDISSSEPLVAPRYSEQVYCKCTKPKAELPRQQRKSLDKNWGALILARLTMSLHRACVHPFVLGYHGRLALDMFDFISAT